MYTLNTPCFMMSPVLFNFFGNVKNSKVLAALIKRYFTNICIPLPCNFESMFPFPLIAKEKLNWRSYNCIYQIHSSPLLLMILQFVLMYKH